MNNAKLNWASRAKLIGGTEDVWGPPLWAVPVPGAPATPQARASKAPNTSPTETGNAPKGREGAE